MKAFCNLLNSFGSLIVFVISCVEFVTYILPPSHYNRLLRIVLVLKELTSWIDFNGKVIIYY